MRTSIFRTFDNELRDSRFALLKAAALAAATAAEGSGFDAMVTGSLSRGQTHPWSDLDVVLVRQDPEAEQDYELESNLESNVSLAIGHVGGDVVFADDIIEPLKKGMLGSLVRPADIPPLGDLPDFNLALSRAAISMEVTLSHIETSDFRGHSTVAQDKRLRGILRRSAISRTFRMLSVRADISLKRLAVYQDGGQSPWLDDHADMKALSALLKRLQAPASFPIERPAVMTADAAKALRWLLGSEPDFMGYNLRQTEAAERKEADTRSAIKEWAGLLRRVSPTTETHGLSPSEGVSPGMR